ncbi:MAG: restriction endonuclease, SacI family [Acidobacteria bacterium]|nr:restriction endonuclease, SacI family [Acidobacteriota bacterium]
MASVDYREAAAVLQISFDRVQRDYPTVQPPRLPGAGEEALRKVFTSKTSAFREALLGCAVARLVNPSINPSKAYVDFGSDAFSGRTLDEKVVNPFLTANQVPCSKSPYLSVLRRSVRFDESMRRGVKDKGAFDGFLALLELVKADPAAVLDRLLCAFIDLREKSHVSVATVPRASLEQLRQLAALLLAEQSGGRFPVLLTVAVLRAVSSTWNLGWSVQFQGINVADSANRAGADISVFHDGSLALALEVTERQVEKTRIESTYKTKIAPLGIRDYLFVVELRKIASEAAEQAARYFAQGHEINFIDLEAWLHHLLATIGGAGRTAFTRELVCLVEARDVPAAIKMSWNNAVFRLTS